MEKSLRQRLEEVIKHPTKSSELKPEPYRYWDDVVISTAYIGL